MYKLLVSMLALTLLLGSCSNDENTKVYTVASQRGDCVLLVPTKCLLVKFDGQQSWTNFYGTIEGFNYELGYEYVIEVREENIPNPPMDGGSVAYFLQKEISKIKKESENLP